MPLTFSAAAIAKKNAQSDSGAWIIFLSIEYPGESAIRICSNNENTVWDSQTWYPVPFRLGDLEESKEGSIPSTNLVISDPTKIILPYLDEYSGGQGASVYWYLCHSSNLASGAEYELVFSITQTTVDSNRNITFSLGAENFYRMRFPKNRYFKNHCQWETFKGTGCLSAVTGSPSAEYTAATTCDRTFTQCRTYGNQARFQGAPAIGKSGVYQ